MPLPLLITIAGLGLSYYGLKGIDVGIDAIWNKFNRNKKLEIPNECARSPFFNGNNLGFLDIVVGPVSCNYQAFNEAVTVIFEPTKHPTFFSWVTALKEHPLMKEILPPHDKMVAKYRQKYPHLMKL
ncbi:hypothetical protein CCACVL1_13938 [Corchorus capsularis]|uniref:Uncharacterized protein n=1 Tax=Corchorus capsularis TaxID=210143 RepID=A0A1R3I8Z6_COCAP|nr:hypothetical protein CCACVL1_13938 [Corchorus capsularis]